MARKARGYTRRKSGATAGSYRAKRASGGRSGGGRKSGARSVRARGSRTQDLRITVVTEPAGTASRPPPFMAPAPAVAPPRKAKF